jgi:hypothetical protein
VSTNTLTDKRKWLGATLAAALTGVVWLAAQGPQEGNGLTFTTVSDPTLFPQTLMATTGNIADPQYGILGGIAFAPDGDVWSAECVFSGTRLHRFDMQQWVAVDPTPARSPTCIPKSRRSTTGLFTSRESIRRRPARAAADS